MSGPRSLTHINIKCEIANYMTDNKWRGNFLDSLVKIPMDILHSCLYRSSDWARLFCTDLSQISGDTNFVRWAVLSQVSAHSVSALCSQCAPDHITLIALSKLYNILHLLTMSMKSNLPITFTDIIKAPRLGLQRTFLMIIRRLRGGAPVRKYDTHPDCHSPLRASSVS